MTSRMPNWQDEGWTPGSVLNDSDLSEFARVTDPFSERGRIRREEYQASGVHPKEFLDQHKQMILEDMYRGTEDEIPGSTKDWLMHRGSPLVDHPDMPPGEDDGRY